MCALQARAKIAQRGRDIGLDFEGEVAALREVTDWDAELRAVREPGLSYPSYYTQPFHAYPEGNLCWDAALQVRCLSVIHNIAHAVNVCRSTAVWDAVQDVSHRLYFCVSCGQSENFSQF